MLNYELFRKVVAPEFATMTDTDLDIFANEAAFELSETRWGQRYPRGLALITAHLIKISKKVEADSGGANTGSVNQLKRVKVGDIEREFAIPNSGTAADNDSYNLTLYGKEFLRLRRQVLMTPLFM